MLALVVDAVVDPVVGSLSDRTRGRWGRRHPYMYAAALPFALCFYLLFAPPAGLGTVGVFAWLLSFSILTRVTQSCYSIPHTAMTAELTTQYDERTLLSALRSLMGSIGTLLVFLLGLQGYFKATAQYPNGQLNPEAYPVFGATFALIICAGVWASALGTHDQIGRLPQYTQGADRFSLLQVLKDATPSVLAAVLQGDGRNVRVVGHDDGDGHRAVSVSGHVVLSVHAHADQLELSGVGRRRLHRRRTHHAADADLHRERKRC